MEHLTREQLLSVLSHAKATRERDWVLFLVSFWHGLRASEAISLTPDHFADGYLKVQRLKGSLRTVQPLVADENELLNERAAVEAWLRTHNTAHAGSGRAKRLFPITRIQFYRLMRRYGRLAGLPQHLCHPHVLKHSIAMQSIHEAGIENVRQYLGHRSISSTGAYLKVTDEAASLAVVKGSRTVNPR
jgi:integrase/recombinase XerD